MTEAAESQTPTMQSVAQESASTQTTPTETPSFSVPEAYQDRGWAKTIASEEDLWKQFDNAQGMLGKKTVPNTDASPEEWDAFYKTLGRPDTAEQYELNTQFEGLPEDVDLGQYKTMASELAHKMGLTPQQASVMWEGYMQAEMDAAQKEKGDLDARQAELDKEYDDLGNKLFGDQMADAQQRATAYLKEIMPPELDGVVESMADNPKALMAMIKIANDSQDRISQVKKQYGAEDNLASGQQAGAMTQQDVLSKIRETKQVINDAPVFSKERKAAEDDLQRYRGMLNK